MNQTPDARSASRMDRRLSAKTVPTVIIRNLRIPQLVRASATTSVPDVLEATKMSAGLAQKAFI